MKDRLNLILRAKNITARQFADEVGIQASGMSHILSGRNNPSLEFVKKVILRYPEISMDWLVWGTGEMIKNNQSTAIIPSTNSTPEQIIEDQPEPIDTPQAPIELKHITTPLPQQDLFSNLFDDTQEDPSEQNNNLSSELEQQNITKKTVTEYINEEASNATMTKPSSETTPIQAPNEDAHHNEQAHEYAPNDNIENESLSRKKNITKIVIFYDDHTFESFEQFL